MFHIFLLLCQPLRVFVAVSFQALVGALHGLYERVHFSRGFLLTGHFRLQVLHAFLQFSRRRVQSRPDILDPSCDCVLERGFPAVFGHLSLCQRHVHGLCQSLVLCLKRLG
ncbi:hypothetical protein F441_10873 [Phytophthora nicotianae CJ01A1]|uniref:Uncharacterized protein n=5 Tax=Phytophthora nicotianae TaxID=4792 RepID=V9EYH4_PHYNI|nr:hypothetical protein F443_10961 [Phytophthora nicotianae P1569]ETK84338.1 hypothetical protein L915_10694 [Phytophthora nicotianae]ETO73005.1 hypothetical protein F444_11019 [Phytophthora nicotianae P1976]ETP14167.1 hypothetical protein F441_10873 [Phytophthora nicotianae CJ01A1]ETP42224.1 hypothetical protein F442_10854 [Phytophthora nicotianae P10297]